MNITPSFETCKALKEAGFKQETEFYYHEDEWDNISLDHKALEDDHGEYCGRILRICAAPTAEEIMEELPATLGTPYYRLTITLEDGNGPNKYCAYYGEDKYKEIGFWNSNLSEALASLWLWAKSNNYLEVGK